MGKDSSLQLDDKIRLHHIGWLWQRILWVILFLFLIAAGLGLFGTGPLSKKRLASTTTDSWVEYERFTRMDSPTVLEMHTKAQDNGKSVIEIPATYLSHFKQEAITPEPSSRFISNEIVQYTYPANGVISVQLHLKPTSSGEVAGTIYLNKEPFEISHFIYP